MHSNHRWLTLALLKVSCNIVHCAFISRFLLWRAQASLCSVPLSRLFKLGSFVSFVQTSPNRLQACNRRVPFRFGSPAKLHVATKLRKAHSRLGIAVVKDVENIYVCEEIWECLYKAFHMTPTTKDFTHHDCRRHMETRLNIYLFIYSTSPGKITRMTCIQYTYRSPCSWVLCIKTVQGFRIILS
jgi:hypothetical protein